VEDAMALSMNILDREIQVQVQDTVPDPVWQNVIEPRLKDFETITNASRDQLSDDQRATFRLTSNIAVFTHVMHDGYPMTRSFMDEPSGTFYWAYDDLTNAGYSPSNRIPCYYFHDAFHIRQWLDGNRDPDLERRVDREVEATLQQAEVASVMHCDALFLDWLIGYAHNRNAIKDRMFAGIGLHKDLGHAVPVIALVEAPGLVAPPEHV
jgi:hypothetical protein